jgi:hypothetical protein
LEVTDAYMHSKLIFLSTTFAKNWLPQALKLKKTDRWKSILPCTSTWVFSWYSGEAGFLKLTTVYLTHSEWGNLKVRINFPFFHCKYTCVDVFYLSIVFACIIPKQFTVYYWTGFLKVPGSIPSWTIIGNSFILHLIGIVREI